MKQIRNEDLYIGKGSTSKSVRTALVAKSLEAKEYDVLVVGAQRQVIISEIEVPIKMLS